MLISIIEIFRPTYFLLRFLIHKSTSLLFQIMFPSVGFVVYMSNATGVIILEYANTEDVHVQKDSNLLSLRVKKVMLISLKKNFILISNLRLCL